jgi:3-isopropylmalate/(R)-2-methylmalate dehydratase small subunit
MEKFTRLTATACPLNFPNLNTDQIIPARFLKRPRAEGFGPMLFHDLRFDAEGRERTFPLDRPAWRGARIAVAARNFGCGSSREAAVYALHDYGMRCVIAPSFGDIFAGNAAQNGFLTAVVSDPEAAEIMAALERTPEQPLTVDLEQQLIVCGNRTYNFTIDPARRTRLLNGWDDIALTESYRERISAFKLNDRVRRPWAMPGP